MRTVADEFKEYVKDDNVDEETLQLPYRYFRDIITKHFLGNHVPYFSNKIDDEQFLTILTKWILEMYPHPRRTIFSVYASKFIGCIMKLFGYDPILSLEIKELYEIIIRFDTGRSPIFDIRKQVLRDAEVNAQAAVTVYENGTPLIVMPYRASNSKKYFEPGPVFILDSTRVHGSHIRRFIERLVSTANLYK